MGTQDTKLTKNAEVSFFKSSYRPYVNFAMEAIEQTISNADFNRKFTVDISRSGDLILDMVLEVTLPTITAAVAGGGDDLVSWVDNLADTMIKTCEINVGGQQIDKTYSEWHTIWNELTLPESKRAGYNDLIGQENVQEVVGASVTDVTVQTANVDERYQRPVTYRYEGLQTPKRSHSAAEVRFVPRFWFCDNPGLALPLIALQYHQVKVIFEMRPLSELLVFSDADGALTEARPTLDSARLFVNYVFLEAAERRITAKKSHEYLITQLQFTGEESLTQSQPAIRLGFNHPCMELVWAAREDGATNANQWTNFETFETNVPAAVGDPGYDLLAGANPFNSAYLQIHGQDRFSVRTGDYFTRFQPYKYHTRIPKSKGIAVYSFSLNPESKQPNGTANFSRIDNPTLRLNMRQISATYNGVLFVYARNVNLFRVAGGMGGVAFAS